MIGNSFKCFCKMNVDIFPLDEFKVHIWQCPEFQNKSPLTKFINGFKLDRLSEEELNMLKCEMELKLEEIKQLLEIKKSNSGFGYIEEKPNDMLPCEKCKKLYDFSEMQFLESCEHSFCKRCLSSEILVSTKSNQDTKCMTCKKPLSELEKKSILGQEAYNKLMDEVAAGGIPTINCVKCNQGILFEPGKLQGNLKDDHGNLISKDKELHYVQNRFKCPSCHIEQCKKCGTTPYHLGKTCEENKKFKESKICKYCNNTCENPSKEVSDVCSGAECLEKLKDACLVVLKCGHSCCGFKGESKCLPCLNEACESKSAPELNGQTGNDYCGICYTESLANAPCIQAGCGHIFHIKCISTRVLKRWHRPRITFNFCNCPLCKKWLEFPKESILFDKMSEYKKLFDEIKTKSMERLKYEKRDKDERITTLGDPYYQKPLEYAIAIYSYYECFKCKKPYFGGLKKCEDLMAEENKNDEFKPEELVCAECSNVGLALENCPKHGKDFIEFKCRFCCSIATWFCWGSTHFCEPCHKRQCAGDYVSKYEKKKLPKCDGKKTCPLKVDHNGNGDEFVLGCALCRNLLNSHDF